MLPSAHMQAAIEKFEREFGNHAGPLVTPEQLERILSINALCDPAARVAKLNEIHEDLQRQLHTLESTRPTLNTQLSRNQAQLHTKDQKIVDELNADWIAGIRAEAGSLLSRATPAPILNAPRRVRLTV